jgi:hypothetical protein
MEAAVHLHGGVLRGRHRLPALLLHAVLGSPGRASAFRPARHGAKCIEKPVENRSVFIKIREISLDWFYRFLINRSVNLIFFKKIKKWFIDFGTDNTDP